MDTQALMAALSAPFPPNAVEQRKGAGGKMLDYIATETVIRRLNRVCPAWDFRITEIREKENLLVVWGELTIPGLGSRAGTGVQVLQGGEDMWKGAASDCLKKCATLFNVGIDLYGPDLEGGELPNHARPNLPPRARTTTQNPIPRDYAPEPEPEGAASWTAFWAEARRAGLNDKTALTDAGIPMDDFKHAGEALTALRAKLNGVAA